MNPHINSNRPARSTRRNAGIALAAVAPVVVAGALLFASGASSVPAAQAQAQPPAPAPAEVSVRAQVRLRADNLDVTARNLRADIDLTFTVPSAGGSAGVTKITCAPVRRRRSEALALRCGPAPRR